MAGSSLLAFLSCAERKLFQRVNGCMQMALREMEIDSRILEPLMTHQQLNGAQVGTGFEQMGREAMAQRVRMNLLGQSGARGCDRQAFQMVLSEMD